MRVLFALLFGLWSSVCLATVYPLQCGNNHGSATHIGDGVLLTCRHCFEGVDSDSLTIDGHDAELLRVSEDSDLATIYCESLKDARGYVPAPDGYNVEVGSTVRAYGYADDGGEFVLFSASNRVTRYLTVNSNLERQATQVECNFTVRPGMSGGALLDEQGYLIGIISGNTVETRQCFATCTTSFWRVVYRVPAYHPWRPVLHVWTSNHCTHCHDFWSDFTRDPEFRAAIEANFRLPRNADGTVNQMYYNVDAKPLLANWWGVNVVPTFGINPANRIVGYGPAPADAPAECRGMDRKGYLLWRLGLIATEQAVPQSPPAQQPTPADPVINTQPTTGCNCGERFQSIEARLNTLAVELRDLAGRQTPAFDSSELEAQIASLRAELDAIELTPGPAGPQGPPGEDGQPRTITVVIEDNQGNRLAAPISVPPNANRVRIPIERFTVAQ